MLPRPTPITTSDRSGGQAGGPPRDADLVADMHAPGSDALAVLVRRYTRLVHRIAADILRDEGEAEDVAQEVFLEIYRKAHLYDPARGPVRGWLLQYAYHRSLRRKDALRRRAAYRGEPLDEAAAAAPGHRDELSRDECRWMIRSGLAQLPDRQRETLELACLQELSLRDVAARMRVSVGCARHYYYRGLTRLRAWARVAGSGSEQGRRRSISRPGRALSDRSENRTPVDGDRAVRSDRTV